MSLGFFLSSRVSNKKPLFSERASGTAAPLHLLATRKSETPTAIGQILHRLSFLQKLVLGDRADQITDAKRSARYSCTARAFRKNWFLAGTTQHFCEVLLHRSSFSENWFCPHQRQAFWKVLLHRSSFFQKWAPLNRRVGGESLRNVEVV